MGSISRTKAGTMYSVLMKKLLIVLTPILIIVGTIAYISTKNESFKTINDTGAKTPAEETSPALSFAWRFENFIPDGTYLPHTRIFLDVVYENGTIITKQIDEDQGDCNTVSPLPDDTDIVKGTDKIQCYAAGFGHWYKITKGEDSYDIKRKSIEESLPDHTPPDYEYENISQYPLMH